MEEGTVTLLTSRWKARTLVCGDGGDEGASFAAPLGGEKTVALFAWLISAAGLALFTLFAEKMW